MYITILPQLKKEREKGASCRLSGKGGKDNKM